MMRCAAYGPVFRRFALSPGNNFIRKQMSTGIYNCNVDAEPVERYRSGGYLPVHLGDVLGHRYKVVHKLGWGGYSTVWLTTDLR